MRGKYARQVQKFVDGLVAGKSQRAAYLDAFPSARKLTKATQYSSACKLAHTPEVKALFDEQRKKADAKSATDAAETRAYLIEQLREIIAGRAPDVTEDFDAGGQLAKRRVQLRQADRLHAIDKLASMLGIDAAEAEKQSIEIILPEELGVMDV